MAEKHALITGPIKGVVTLPDGREVDVTEHVVYLDSLEDAQAVAHQIGLRHEEQGHPEHLAPGDPPFVYVPPADLES
jgi:hypothetical protein